jgi:hypothetical protein
VLIWGVLSTFQRYTCPTISESLLKVNSSESILRIKARHTLPQRRRVLCMGEDTPMKLATAISEKCYQPELNTCY